MDVKKRLLVLCSIVLLGVALIDMRRYRQAEQLDTSSLPLISNARVNSQNPTAALSGDRSVDLTSYTRPFSVQSASEQFVNREAVDAASTSYLTTVDSNKVNAQQVVRPAVSAASFDQVLLQEAALLRTGEVVKFKSKDGLSITVVYPVPRNGSTPGLAGTHNESDAYGHFIVDVVADDTVQLKFTDKYYLTTSCCEGDHHTISLVDEDSSSSSSAINFTVVPADVSGFVQLRVSNGYYLSTTSQAGPLVLTSIGDKEGSYFSIETVYPAPNGLVVNPDLVLYTGDVITIRTINQTYWKRYAPFPVAGMSGIIAYRKYVDAWSLIKVEVVSTNELHMVAENGLYLKRYCCWRSESVIATYLDSPDAYSRFTMIPVGARQVQFKAENNEYWTMFNAGGGYGVPITSELGSLMIQNFFLELVQPHNAVTLSGATYLKSGDKMTLALESNGSFVESYSPFASGTAGSGLVASRTASDAAIFTITVVSPSQMYIKAPGTSTGYWKWACCYENDGDHFFIATDAAQPDPKLSAFFFYTLGDGRVLIRAPNGDYLTASHSHEGKPVITTTREAEHGLTFKINVLV